MKRYRRWGFTAAALALLMSVAVPPARAWNNPDTPGMPGHPTDDPNMSPPVDEVGDPDQGGNGIVYYANEYFVVMVMHHRLLIAHAIPSRGTNDARRPARAAIRFWRLTNAR